MRGSCSICDNDNYHALCAKCGNCQDHCTCQVAQPSDPEVCGTSSANDIEKCINPGRPEAGIVLLMQVSKRHPKWGHICCDSFCHQSTLPVAQCDCLCGGAFHGLVEGSAKFTYAIGVHGARLVAKWKDLGVDTSGLEKEMQRLALAVAGG